jgi:hypothetical protein
MILLEIERQLYHAYLATIALQDNLMHGYEVMKDNPSALAIHLAEGFMLWIEHRKSQSTNEVLCAMIQFVELSRYYRLFRESSRGGDSITMEHLYNQFIPIWLAVGKHHYYKIGLSQIEELYAWTPIMCCSCCGLIKLCHCMRGLTKPAVPWQIGRLTRAPSAQIQGDAIPQFN